MVGPRSLLSVPELWRDLLIVKANYALGEFTLPTSYYQKSSVRPFFLQVNVFVVCRVRSERSDRFDVDSTTIRSLTSYCSFIQKERLNQYKIQLIVTWHGFNVPETGPNMSSIVHRYFRRIDCRRLSSRIDIDSTSTRCTVSHWVLQLTTTQDTSRNKAVTFPLYPWSFYFFVHWVMLNHCHNELRGLYSSWPKNLLNAICQYAV